MSGLVKKARLVSPVIRVDVTEDIILESKMSDSSHCMIAEAVKTAVPNAAYVSVDLATIRFTDPIKKLRYTYFTPRVAQLALLNFDQGQLPEPFSFQIRSAGQIRRAGWKASHKSGTKRSELSDGKNAKNAKSGQKKKRKTIKGTTVRGGKAMPRMGTRRAFGLRSFILGGAIGRGAGA